MRREWQLYLRRSTPKPRSLALALAISLLFALVYLPSLPAAERTSQLFHSLLYGLTVYLGVWAAYAGYHAFLTWRLISAGTPIRVGLLAHFGISLTGVGCGLFGMAWLRSSWGGQPMEFGSILPSLLIGAFISAGFIFYHAYRNSEAEKLRFQSLSAEARYQSLKSQLQPHFLFNSLNTLAELIESEPSHAAEMSQKLSDLYREILENSKAKTSPLSSEASIVRKYLELERLRFGERLQFELSLPAVADQIHVPSLILQTLVENAVKHGVAPSIEGGRIELVVMARGGDGFEVSIRNTGAPYQPSAGTVGTGLANTRARLGLLYGDRHRFEISQGTDGATRVRFFVSGAMHG